MLKKSTNIAEYILRRVAFPLPGGRNICFEILQKSKIIAEYFLRRVAFPLLGGRKCSESEDETACLPSEAVPVFYHHLHHQHRHLCYHCYHCYHNHRQHHHHETGASLQSEANPVFHLLHLPRHQHQHHHHSCRHNRPVWSNYHHDYLKWSVWYIPGSLPGSSLGPWEVTPSFRFVVPTHDSGTQICFFIWDILGK